MCDYLRNNDVLKYGSALDVMKPLTAQFCVACWVKERKIGLHYMQKGLCLRKALFSEWIQYVKT